MHLVVHAVQIDEDRLKCIWLSRQCTSTKVLLLYIDLHAYDATQQPRMQPHCIFMHNMYAFAELQAGMPGPAKTHLLVLPMVVPLS